MSMYIGEALAGDATAAEIAHIDLLIGSKDGPVGNAHARPNGNRSRRTMTLHHHRLGALGHGGNGRDEIPVELGDAAVHAVGIRREDEDAELASGRR